MSYNLEKFGSTNLKKHRRKSVACYQCHSRYFRRAEEAEGSAVTSPKLNIFWYTWQFFPFSSYSVRPFVREAAEKKQKFQEELRRQIQSNKAKLMEQDREKQLMMEKNKASILSFCPSPRHNCNYFTLPSSLQAYLASYETEMRQEEMKKALNFKSERSMRLNQIQERLGWLATAAHLIFNLALTFLTIGKRLENTSDSSGSPSNRRKWLGPSDWLWRKRCRHTENRNAV